VTPRLERTARREQLLDVAADLVLERGMPACTMEGLAARAGVSKAVPYLHFDNADGVLAALLRREMQRVADRVIEAVRFEGTAEEHLRASIAAYLDVVIERGAILAVLYGPGSVIPSLVDEHGFGSHEFVADLLRRGFPIDKNQSYVAAAVLVGALVGAVDLMKQRRVPRAEIEDGVFDAVRGLLRTYAAAGTDGPGSGAASGTSVPSPR
jgi:AcrR family transcriptional regulator